MTFKASLAVKCSARNLLEEKRIHESVPTAWVKLVFLPVSWRADDTPLLFYSPYMFSRGKINFHILRTATAPARQAARAPLQLTDVNFF